MPTYQYACGDCGEQLEVVQKFTDDALTVCPNCQGTLRKVFNAVGIVFKGSGFYRNDSRESSNGKKASTSAGASDGTESSNGSGASTSSSSSSESSGSGSDSSAGAGKSTSTDAKPKATTESAA